MASSAIQRTVSQETANFFIENNLLSEISHNKRKLSTSTLSPPPSIRSDSSSSISGGPVSPSSFQAAYIYQRTDSIDIPVILASRETLECIGFSTQASRRIWENYENCTNAQFEVDLLELALSHIDDNPVECGDDWYFYMRAIGISDWLQDAIMIPECSDVRHTASCKFWLLETVADNYESLKRLGKRLDLKAQEMRTAQGKKSRIGGATRPLTRTPTLTNPVGRKERLSISDVPSGPTSAPLSAEAEASTSKDTPQPTLETITIDPIGPFGYAKLWRAAVRWKVKEFYDPVTQEINLTAMTTTPGDFNYRRPVVYWTPQKETADRYATFYKHKTGYEDIVIIEMYVPEVFIRTLDVKYLWLDDARNEWRKLVWLCRRRQHLTPDLKYLTSKALLIGHASGINEKYEQMDHFSQIEERHLLQVLIDNVQTMAIQWVFNTDAAEDGVALHCKGRIQVHNIGTMKVPPEI